MVVEPFMFSSAEGKWGPGRRRNSRSSWVGPGAGMSAGGGVTRVAGSGRRERDEGLGRATKSVDRLPPQLLLSEKVGLDDGVPVSPMKDRRG